jgi:PAS domain S-box-containing protein
LKTSLESLPLVDRVAVPALVVGADGRIVAANAALARVLGVDIAAMRDSALADWLIDGAPLEAFLRSASGTCGEFVFRDGNGAARRLALTRALADAGGDLFTVFDLTPLAAVEQQLREEMRRYQDMTGATSDFFFELDATMTRLRILRRVRDGRLVVLEQQRKWPDEVIDLTYDLDAFANVIRKMLAREPVRDYIHRQRDADGSERFLRSGGVPYYDAQGVFQGYRGVSVDVTAQVLAERALRDSEARLRRSQQHLDQAQRVAATGSVERDLATGAEEWSDEMYRLLGVERDAVAPSDETVSALLHAEDRARVQEATRLARSGFAPRAGEFRIHRADGEIRTLYCETEFVRDDKGKAIRSMAVFRDVTELRAAEVRQKDMERQLLHAQKLESLGTLAGGIAHDLNNTLVPVLALTKITAERLPLESRERKNLVTVMRASERARDLVRQILAFSRKEETERQPLDFAAVVREALGMLRASVPATVRISECIAEVPSVFGDGGKLHQVVINLVTNAAHAIGDAMGSISIELAVLEQERAARLTVVDTGCGMDERVMARIFEPFFTTKGVGQGTGLGLSVVHGIVSSHGGRMEVKSRVGEGTSFAVYLPLAGDPTGQAEADAASAGADASAAD